MAKAEVALEFHIQATQDGGGEVRAPDGRLVCILPDPVARGWMLGVMRLASWAHAQLKDEPLELYKVLQVNPVVNEAEQFVADRAALYGPQGEPLI